MKRALRRALFDKSVDIYTKIAYNTGYIEKYAPRDLSRNNSRSIYLGGNSVKRKLFNVLSQIAKVVLLGGGWIKIR